MARDPSERGAVERLAACPPAPPATGRCRTSGKKPLVVSAAATRRWRRHLPHQVRLKVTVVHRRDTLRASKIMQERAFNNPKIGSLWNKTVDKILGRRAASRACALQEPEDGRARGVAARRRLHRHRPQAEHGAFGGQLEMDPHGYIVTSAGTTDDQRRGRVRRRRRPGPATARPSPRPAAAAWRRSTPSGSSREHVGDQERSPGLARMPGYCCSTSTGPWLEAARGRGYRREVAGAIEAIFGTAGRLDEVSFAGKTDLAILREALEPAGIAPAEVRERLGDWERGGLTS